MKPKWLIRDQYKLNGTFDKRLASNFLFYSQGFKFAVTQKNITEPNTMLSVMKGDMRPEIYAVGRDGKLAHIANWKTLALGAEIGLWERYDPARHNRPQAEVDAMEKTNAISFLI